jgi:predicted molibdopterin-dependent oxidoreductase YjgC
VRIVGFPHTLVGEVGMRFCGVGLTPQVQDNETAKVTSPRASPVTCSNLDIKGRFGHQHAQNRG